MNKLVLKYELDLDFVLIALTVPLKDYRLCFNINKQLNLEFYRIEELCLQLNPKSPASYFSMYHHGSEETDADFYLLSNKGTEGFLVPEMRTADYFIIIKNFIDEEDLEHFIAGLNKIPEVQVAVEVNPGRLKSKENLIF